MVHPFGTVTVTVTAAAVAAASAPSATGVAYASVRAISSMLLSCQMRCASVSHACMHCMYLCICAFVHVWPECVCYKHNIVIHDVITARTTNRSQKSHQNARRGWFAFAGGIKFQNFPVCDMRRVCVCVARTPYENFSEHIEWTKLFCKFAPFFTVVCSAHEWQRSLFSHDIQTGSHIYPRIHFTNSTIINM